jgi:hypothetical protein
MASFPSTLREHPTATKAGPHEAQKNIPLREVEGSTKRNQGILDQVCHLRSRALFLIKDPMVSLLPNEPPKKEHYPSIDLLFTFGSSTIDSR